MVTGGWAPREGAGASGHGDNLVEIFQAISPSRPFAHLRKIVSNVGKRRPWIRTLIISRP